MSKLILDGALSPDPWTRVEDDADLPASGRLLVSLARWEQEGAGLASEGREIGVCLPNDAKVLDLAPGLLQLPLLALRFPSFADGRAYSQARLLRDHHGYRGQLRAVGAAVVRDQLPSLHRCGFNAFELREDQDPAACLQTLAALGPVYQPAQDQRPLVRELRNRDLAHSD